MVIISLFPSSYVPMPYSPISLFPYALCSMPYALCPMLYALSPILPILPIPLINPIYPISPISPISPIYFTPPSPFHNHQSSLLMKSPQRYIQIQHDQNANHGTKGSNPLMPFAVGLGNNFVADDVEHGTGGKSHGVG